jgi:putative chitinase
VITIPEKFRAGFDRGMALYDINTPERKAAFLANIAHESGNFKYTVELWGKKPSKWQARYEGHKGLGNNQPGDGYRYRGRGFLQITGRANYRNVTKWLRDVDPNCPDFEADPDALATPEWASISACAWWANNRCNQAADTGDISKTRRIVNGTKMLGLAEVTKTYKELLHGGI